MAHHFPAIIIENNAFKKIPQKIKGAGHSFAIITDPHLKKLGEELLEQMRRNGLNANLLIVPAGEKTKSLAVVEKLAQSLVKLGFRRDGCIIALGGGVIGDLAGFLASIYMRGIPFVIIPTTLLAMVDASIGGKTGVDLAEGKNLLGTFYHPIMVMMDLALLKSLPERDYKAGLAEIVKHGVIADAKYFKFLEKNCTAIMQRKLHVLKKMIAESVRIKMNIVRRDEKEAVRKFAGDFHAEGTSRMLLNYGHTVGHALEKLSGYDLSHGEAISIGMVAENRVAVGKKLLKERDALRIKNLLQRFRLPIKIPAEYSPHAIKKALMSDKKYVGGKLHFALPVKIGKARILAL